MRCQRMSVHLSFQPGCAGSSSTLNTTVLHVCASCRLKVVVPREFNPQFEMDFNSKADYDFDRQRSEAKKLQRQMVKEKRGAMRELRRDASFMAAVSVYVQLVWLHFPPQGITHAALGVMQCTSGPLIPANCA